MSYGKFVSKVKVPGSSGKGRKVKVKFHRTTYRPPKAR